MVVLRRRCPTSSTGSPAPTSRSAPSASWSWCRCSSSACTAVRWPTTSTAAGCWSAPALAQVAADRGAGGQRVRRPQRALGDLRRRRPARRGRGVAAPVEGGARAAHRRARPDHRRQRALVARACRSACSPARPSAACWWPPSGWAGASPSTSRPAGRHRAVRRDAALPARERDDPAQPARHRRGAHLRAAPPRPARHLPHRHHRDAAGDAGRALPGAGRGRLRAIPSCSACSTPPRPSAACSRPPPPGGRRTCTTTAGRS